MRLRFPKPIPRPKRKPARIKRTARPARRVHKKPASTARGHKCGLYAHECGQRDMAAPCRKSIKRRVPVKRQSSRRQRVIEADRAWAAKIKLLFEGMCARTGRPGTDAHHIYPKSVYPRLRHDLDNGVLLTRAEHRRAHANMTVFRMWFAEHFPATWDRLEEKAMRKARLS